MAYILKDGEVLTDELGNTYNDAIMAVDNIRLSKEGNKQAIITLNIFHTQLARTNWKSGQNIRVLKKYNFIVKNTSFDTYFSPTNSANYTDIYATAYSYLTNIQPNEFNSSLDWSIWESDEV